MFGYDNHTNTNNISLFVLVCSGRNTDPTQLNTRVNPTDCVHGCSHPPSPTMRSEEQRLLSSSMTASLTPWFSNTDLITGPGIKAGLNGQLLTQTQTHFSIIKANILSVIQHHFSCTEVRLTMPVSSKGLLWGCKRTICLVFSSSHNEPMEQSLTEEF